MPSNFYIKILIKFVSCIIGLIQKRLSQHKYSSYTYFKPKTFDFTKLWKDKERKGQENDRFGKIN